MLIRCLAAFRRMPVVTIRRIQKTIFLGLTGFLYACSQHNSAPLGQGPLQELRRGLSGEPASLDPASAADTFSSQVIQDLYEGLTRESPTGEVVPGVASSWTVDPTGTRYTFQLRPDAHWSNGKLVRAEEFISSWERALDPKTASPVANELRLIAGASAIISGALPPTSLGVTAPSHDILVVDLVQPAPYFPQLLSHSAAFPIYSEVSARSHDPRVLVSNGPFILSDWHVGTNIELRRNSAYWDQSKVNLDRVEYQFSPDQNSQFAAYRSGQLDMTDTVPANAVASLRKDHSRELFVAPYLATAYYGLNFVSPPLKGNIKLRTALTLAIDRQQIVDALGLGQSQAFGFVPPSTWNYEPQRWEWEKLPNDARIAQARKTYVEAGFSLASPLRLRLLLNSNPSIKQTAIIVSAMWKEVLGIETILSDEEFKVFLESRHDRKKWDVVRLAWNADYNDASSFLDIFRSNSPNNDTGYFNPTFEKYLDDAAKTPDATTRRGLLESAERQLLNDYPVIPLYFLVSKRLVKPYVSGMTPNALDRVGSKSLSVLPH
jgi:oligopeptide transport system substrate-binding protein